jgi:hypothetical protein
MTAFDFLGGTLGSVTDVDNPQGVNLSLNISGIHAVTITQTSATIGLDNLAFNRVTPVPEPASMALWLSGLGLLGWASRRRTTA